jgi:hypothetical protein
MMKLFKVLTIVAVHATILDSLVKTRADIMDSLYRTRAYISNSIINAFNNEHFSSELRSSSEFGSSSELGSSSEQPISQLNEDYTNALVTTNSFNLNTRSITKVSPLSYNLVNMYTFHKIPVMTNRSIDGLHILNITDITNPLNLTIFITQSKLLYYEKPFQWFYNGLSELELALNDIGGFCRLQHNDIPQFYEIIPQIAQNIDLNNESCVTCNTANNLNNESSVTNLNSESSVTSNLNSESIIRQLYYDTLLKQYKKCMPLACSFNMVQCLMEGQHKGFISIQKSKNQTDVLFYEFVFKNNRIALNGTLVSGFINNLPQLFDHKRVCVLGYCYDWYDEREYQIDDLKTIKKIIEQYIFNQTNI